MNEEDKHDMISKDRSIRAKRNSITTLANQLVATITGILIPIIMIDAFGSVMYGATTSISHFLSYIALLESGIGRAARSALYQPLAQNDITGVSKVYYAIRRFFQGVAIVFIIYTIILAYFYYDIANVENITRRYLFFLVIAISLSILIDYLFGISNQTLLNADQRKYITNLAVIVTRILNTLLILVLIHLGSGLIFVKLISGIVIILRPLFLSWYVKRHYKLTKVPREEAVLPQKWSGMAQHIAYFIHTNTDILLLTIFADLRLVAVYTVYSLIITSIRSLIISMVGGMEAELGDMYARGEQEALVKRYRQYQFITSMTTVVLLGATNFLILPFVQLYTKGVSDANYIQPLFGLILTLGEAVNCLALPASTLPVSAGQLKQSQWGSFGEAFINISVSCLLIKWNPLLGVAIGTLAAEIYKLIYYNIYSSHRILQKPLLYSNACYLLIIAVVLVFGIAGMWVSSNIVIRNFLIWMIWSISATAAAGCIALLVGLVCYSNETRSLLNKFRKILDHIC